MSRAIVSRATVSSKNTEQLMLLGALALLVPGIWLLLLGWSPGKLIDQGDNLASWYVYIEHLIAAGGNWQEMLFWPGLLGGVIVHDLTGSLPFVQLMAKLGAGFITISNVSILLLQVLFGFFCARAVAGLSLAGHWQRPVPLVTLVLVGVMFAFLPALGWRVTEGHQTIVQGLFVLVCMTVLILDETNQERSLLTVLMALIVLSNVFQFNGFQTMYYSVVFGAPLILGLLMIPGDRTLPERFLLTVFPVAVFFCAMLFALPKLWGIFSNVFGEDSGRVYGSAVIYSYTTATPVDWLTSLPWSRDLIPEDRLPFRFEVNYPIGTFMLAFLLGGVSRTTVSLGTGIVISLAMALIISMNLQPVSDVLVSMVPMMESFRVPARAILPVLVFASIVVVTILVNLGRSGDEGTRSLKMTLLVVLVLLVSSQLPVLVLDMLLLLVVVTLFFARSLTQRQPTIPVLLAVIVGAAIGAFQSRIHEPVEAPVAGVAAAKQLVLEQAPALNRPLVRAHTRISMPHVGPNTMYSMGIGSLTGYWFPPGRFLQLYSAANETPVNPATNVFLSQDHAPGFALLNRLYNVRYQVEVEGQQLVARPIDGATPGEAWFSQQVAWHPDMASLVHAIRPLDAAALASTSHMISQDSRASQLEDVSLECAAGEAAVSHPEDQPFPLVVETRVDGTCLLTLSVNYSGIFSARDGAGEPLQTQPAYGALLSVVVPAGTKQVTIEPVPTRFTGIEASYGIASLLALLLLYLSAGQSRRRV